MNSKGADLRDCSKRLWWSQEDMEQLNQIMLDFRDTHQRAVRVETHGAGGAAFLHGDVQPPAEMERLICVILHHFRAALNYFAYQLAILDTGENPPPHEARIEFPIFTNATEFARQQWINQISDKHRTLLESVQPYDGRSRSLRILYELDRINRHRLLHPTVVYTAPTHHDVMVEGGTLKSMEILYRGPFKHGTEVLRFEVEGQGEVKVYPQVALFVCIDHTLTRDRQALGVLSDIGKTIVEIIELFANEFPDLRA